MIGFIHLLTNWLHVQLFASQEEADEYERINARSTDSTQDDMEVGDSDLPDALPS